MTPSQPARTRSSGPGSWSRFPAPKQCLRRHVVGCVFLRDSDTTSVPDRVGRRHNRRRLCRGHGQRGGGNSRSTNGGQSGSCRAWSVLLLISRSFLLERLAYTAADLGCERGSSFTAALMNAQMLPYEIAPCSSLRVVAALAAASAMSLPAMLL